MGFLSLWERLGEGECIGKVVLEQVQNRGSRCCPPTRFFPMSDPISYDDVLAAEKLVHAHLPRTPLYAWPGLCELLGCEFFLKHENHLPTGAFKVRGGVNLVGGLSREEQQQGLIGVSTGNHGQSLAFACWRFDAPLTVVVPERNNPDKLRVMKHWGAEIVEHGRDFDEAREYCEQLAADKGLRYVHSANEPKLIAGVATCTLEILEDLQQPDVILVPIGLGSGASGAALTAHWLSPGTEVIGVQAERAASVALSWREGKIVSTGSADTWAEGLATRVPAEMTMDILGRHLSDVVLLSEDELRDAVRLLLEQTHNLVEGAGAASTAAAFKLRDRLRGKRVVGIVSGGNLDLRELAAILQR